MGDMAGATEWLRDGSRHSERILPGATRSAKDGDAK